MKSKPISPAITQHKTMKVFHGSTSIVDKPLANIGRNHLDFGKGFYLTTLENQAISWASRPLNQAEQSNLHS